MLAPVGLDSNGANAEREQCPRMILVEISEALSLIHSAVVSYAVRS